MSETKFRINHELYAKVRKAKHEEKTQIFEDSTDRIGVRIDWNHFGKVLEAKKRKQLGDKYVLETQPTKIVKDKPSFSLGLFVTEMFSSFNGLFGSLN